MDVSAKRSCSYLFVSLTCYIFILSRFGPGTACPDDWVLFEGTGMCYKFVSTRLAWLDAEAACQTEQAHLASVHSSEEQDFIDRGSFWIGFNDLDNEGTFVWSDGTDVNITFWNRGEPNDIGNSEDCTVTWPAGFWNDDGCWKQIPYVCKKACTDIWVQFKGTGMCYKFVTTSATWFDAEAACQAEQAHLVSIHSQEEHAFIGRIESTRNSWWSGFNDIDNEGAFVWSDGTEANITFWKVGEPNDSGNSEDCTAMWPPIWNDEWCWKLFPYVCKKDYHCPYQDTGGGLTWPMTERGSTAESIERCPLHTTMNGGVALAIRNCSTSGLWEDYEIRSCGDVIDWITLEDVEEVDIGSNNVVEVAEFLANYTSMNPLDADDLEAVSNILLNVVGLRSGKSEVTETMVATVSNVILAAPTSPDARNSSSIIRSLETQVSLTLQQEGQISIRQDSVHVEAVSLNPTHASNGLAFASTRRSNDSQPGQRSSPEGPLAGTEIRTFVNISEIPNVVDVVLLASVQLPGNIVDLQQSANNYSPAKFRASFLIYGNDTLFNSALIREYEGENGSSLRVAAPVVSLTVEDVDLVNLTEPLVLEFKAPADGSEEELGKFWCVAWDFDLRDGVGDWSPAGCKLTEVTNEKVSCECNHATNFAILVDVKGQILQDNPTAKRALDMISRIGSALSIAALVITLVIYLSIRKLRSSKSRQIFINFCFSLLMLYIAFLAGVDTAKGYVCVFVAALLHYLTLSTMMWMAVEARNMYVSTVKVFPEDSPYYMVKACLTAWGSPLIVLAVTLATALDQYKNQHYCFLLPGLVLYLGLLLPIGLILIHNVVTFILVMRSLLKMTEASRSQQISKRLQNAVGISTLMGLTWSFGFLAISDATFVFQLIFCIANSLQGVVVFLMFCVRRAEVRSAIAPYMTRICCSCICRPPSPSRGRSTSGELSSSSIATSPSTVSRTTNVYETRINHCVP